MKKWKNEKKKKLLRWKELMKEIDKLNKKQNKP